MKNRGNIGKSKKDGKKRKWLAWIVLLIAIFVGIILSAGVGYIWPNHKNNIYAIIIIWITLIEIVVCLELKMLSFIQEQRKIQKYISLSFCIGGIALWWTFLISQIHEEMFPFYCVVVLAGTVTYIIIEIRKWRER